MDQTNRKGRGKPLRSINELEAENASLKARMRKAQLRLDGGNDCFDSLEEVVEATVQGGRELRGAISKLSTLLKVPARWDRIIPAVESAVSSSPTVEAAEIGNEYGNVVGAILKLIDLDENFECHWNRIRQRWSVSIPTLGIDIADESLLAVMQAARDAAPIPSEPPKNLEIEATGE